MGEEGTVNDVKARQQLGYTSAVTIEEGLKELYDTEESNASQKQT